MGWAGASSSPCHGLTRAGSRAAVRSPGPGSPGPPRSEPSTRGSERKRVGFSNLNRRPDVWLQVGDEMEVEARPESLRATAPGNSHCTPTRTGYKYVE
jgi:hypothetical protein